LARAFVTKPKLLLADEPTGNLDAATGAGVIDLMFELNAESGTTLLLVTHDDAIASRCARKIRLVAGRIEGSAVFRLSLRMLVRAWRAGELRVLALALVLAVGSVASVAFFADRVRQALTRDAHQVLGADVLLTADHPWSAEFR